MKKTLREIFDSHEGRLVRKWLHYFDAYESHFERFRDREMVLLEIGVCDGGSLQVWREYFGPKARIIGVDLDPRCKAFEDEGIEIHIGSQDDRSFLRQLRASIPAVDILIDDGGHTMNQQITTFEELFGHVRTDGVYLCEDVHTSYWPLYGGGHRQQGTFIEYCKGLIDQLNAWHSREAEFAADHFTRTAASMHFYDSIVAIEKRVITEPKVQGRGRWIYYPDDLQKVLDVYDHSINADKPAPLWIRLNYGDALFQAGRLNEARNILQSCLSTNNEAWSIHLKLAQVDFKAMDFRSAIVHCKNTLKLKPGLVPALLILAEANVELKEPLQSKHYLGEVLKTNPAHKGAQRILELLD